MRWVAIFEDTPEMADVRRSHEPEHLEFLRKHQNEILLAGGLRNVPGGPFVGGLWVLEVNSRERAAELIAQDPYSMHSSRGYELSVWGKAFPEMQVTL